MSKSEKTSHPGIRKITTRVGVTKYRLIIDMGERPDGGRDQRCETFDRLGDAKARQSEIRNSRGKGTLVRPSKITVEELCQRWLDSRHDVREITRIGYQEVLKPVRAQIGRTKVQDLTRSRIESLIRSLRDDRGLSHRSTCTHSEQSSRSSPTGSLRGAWRSTWRPASRHRENSTVTASPRSSGHLKS
jgi:hypothetical protein